MSVFRLLATLALALGCTIANAQDWPTKIVKFVSPYPPGGSVDPLARLFGAKLSESLKQQFIVENRTGASGIIGTEYVAKSAPDGYTFVFIFDTHAVHQALNPKLPFDPLKDFAPVMIVGTAPMAISTGAGKPYKSFARRARERRRRSPTPSASAMSATARSATSRASCVSQAAGVKLVPVPYKGGGPLHTDALGGQIELAHRLGGGAGRAREGRQAARARADGREALGDDARRADAGRGGRARHRSRLCVLGHPRAGRHAAADHRQAARRDREGDEAARTSTRRSPRRSAWTWRRSARKRPQKFIAEQMARWGKVVRDNNIRAE